MDRRAWWATVHGIAESGTTDQLIEYSKNEETVRIISEFVAITVIIRS